MRTITLEDYRHSMILLHLHRTGRAKIVGPVKANERRQWVRTFGDRVIHIGLVLKSEVKI